MTEMKPTGQDRRAQLGADGEDRVLAWYKERGYVLVARNWRCQRGEIDLIVRRGSALVFCEVKTRTSNAFGGPFAAVGVRKQRRLRTLAILWLEEADPQGASELRFDVAGVIDRSVEVIEAAF